jgi:hypothetical protein
MFGLLRRGKAGTAVSGSARLGGARSVLFRLGKARQGRPGVDRSVRFRRGVAGHGKAGFSKAGRSVLRRGQALLVGDWRGKAGGVRRGIFRWGMASRFVVRQGVARQARLGSAAHRIAWCGTSEQGRRGLSLHGNAVSGTFRQGKAGTACLVQASHRKARQG